MNTSSLVNVLLIEPVDRFLLPFEDAVLFIVPEDPFIPFSSKYVSNCLTSTLSITFLAAPWLQMVMAGNSMFSIGYAVVLMVVIVGLACHSM